ncbi:MAG: hypothetical protein FWC47_11915, partial [Oscillospiraceae bacterium]|nr:hypothetical protein [Oscillospiraceae bacterium]
MAGIKKSETIKVWDFSDNNNKEEKPTKAKVATKEEILKTWDFIDEENEETIKVWDFNSGENGELIKEWNFSDDKKEELVQEKDSIIDLDTRVKYMEKIEYIELTKLQNIDSS